VEEFNTFKQFKWFKAPGNESFLTVFQTGFFTKLLVVFILALAFIFTGPALAADKLRIGYGAPSVAMSVLWITKEGKLFEKNGLDVEVLYLESVLVQRALIAGNIDYGEMTGSLMAAPKLQGADLVMIAGFLNQLIYRLVTRPEIKAIADLRGKRVAVSRFGAGADRATRFLLTKLGFNPEKDVVLIQVGGADEIGGISGQFRRCNHR
jgi:NitT/TauT family transport system substrate-binding protein